jgi:hypothetical protein
VGHPGRGLLGSRIDLNPRSILYAEGVEYSSLGSVRRATASTNATLGVESKTHKGRATTLGLASQRVSRALETSLPTLVCIVYRRIWRRTIGRAIVDPNHLKYAESDVALCCPQGVKAKGE